MRATQELLIESYWADGMSAPAIAARMGISVGQVWGFINGNRHRCPRRYNPPERHAKLVELWRTDLTVAEIADIVGMTASGVTAHAHDHRDEFPLRKSGPRKGARRKNE